MLINWNLIITLINISITIKMKTQNNFQIGLEQICSISSKLLLDPKQLICCICFCININPKQCINKKCNKIFCGKCYSHLMAKSGTPQPLCPFCRTLFDYRKVDENLLVSVASLNFYCANSISCTGQYSYNEMISKHNHKSNDLYLKCQKCKRDNDWKFAIKCGLCQKYYCSSKERKNCIRKCFKCLTPICYSCLKGDDKILCGLCECKCSLCLKTDANKICNLCKAALCSNCSENCETCNKTVCFNSKCINASYSCKKCSLIKPSSLYLSCLHQVRLKCNQCFSQCSSCFKNTSDNKCSICSMSICSQTCTSKCKTCNRIICDQCTMKCLICKKTSCDQCSKWCYKCGLNNSIVTCGKCCIGSNIIRKCDKVSCIKNICINCWNVCNYCGIINCSNHSFNCSNCEESICNTHYSQCSKCKKGNDKSHLVKCCLKNCTFKCNFCANESNALCRKENHSKSLVGSYNCEHYVCLTCVKYCGKCRVIVISCPKCIVNYYFSLCKYCNAYLCQSCSKDTCSKCDEAICCLVHKCKFCNKGIDPGICLNCLFQYRAKCFYCNKALKQSCIKCNKTVICSLFCYYNYKESQYRQKIDKSEGNILLEGDLPHELDEMFICNSHFKGSETLLELYTQMIISNKQYIIEQIPPLESECDGRSTNKTTDLLSKKNRKCPNCNII